MPAPRWHNVLLWRDGTMATHCTIACHARRRDIAPPVRQHATVHATRGFCHLANVARDRVGAEGHRPLLAFLFSSRKGLLATCSARWMPVAVRSTASSSCLQLLMREKELLTARQ